MIQNSLRQVKEDDNISAEGDEDASQDEVFENPPVPEEPEITNEKVLAIGWNNKFKVFMVSANDFTAYQITKNEHVGH